LHLVGLLSNVMIILNLFHYAKPQINRILFVVREPIVGLGLLIVEDPRSHSDTQ